MCKASADDEVHFIFYCQAYDELRKKCLLFGKDIAKRKDVSALLVSKDDTIICLMAKFISEAWNIRYKTIMSNKSCMV